MGRTVNCCGYQRIFPIYISGASEGENKKIQALAVGEDFPPRI
jgi:hypothetical protein